MISLSFFFVLASSMMVVFLCLSSPRVSFSFVASSVRFTYSASSLAANLRAVVVFPVHGVPVMRMTFFGMAFSKVLFRCVVFICFGLASWCVAVGPSRGSEETPPTCRVAASARAQGESLGYGAETERPPLRHVR